MLHLVIRRVGMLILAMFVVSVLAFATPYLTSDDPTRQILRSRVAEMPADPQAMAALQSDLGLDRPVVVQYFDWLGQVLTGDLGYSYTNQLPVSGQVSSAVAVSFVLATAALVCALLIALPLGTLAAMRPGGRFDNAITVLTQSFVAIPEYWLAPVLILVFPLTLGWFNSAGWQGPADLVLPATVLALRPLAYFVRVIRASMINVLRSPYIMAARARGLGPTQTLTRHGIRNGSLPVMTLFSLWLAGLLGGSVVVEVIFAIPGMGRLMYDAVVNADVPMMQAGLMTIVGLSVLIATVTDLAYGLLNPAVQVSDSRG